MSALVLTNHHGCRDASSLTGTVGAGARAGPVPAVVGRRRAPATVDTHKNVHYTSSQPTGLAIYTATTIQGTAMGLQAPTCTWSHTRRIGRSLGRSPCRSLGRSLGRFRGHSHGRSLCRSRGPSPAPCGLHRCGRRRRCGFCRRRLRHLLRPRRC